MFQQALMMGGAGGGGLRTFTISPAVSGQTTWNLDVDGALNLQTHGEWTITPTVDFSASIKLWGGGGGGGNDDAPAFGGGGGFAAGEFDFVNGTAYKIVVGSAGVNGKTSRSDFGEGGDAGSSLAASGGGYTGLFQNAMVSQANTVAVAGGGGGSGATRNKHGGAGGGTSGVDGGGSSGVGGSQVSGGAVSGSALYGGNGSTHAGGGGGGYFGGGGGSGGTGNRGSGGGGSGYVDVGLSNTTSTAGSGVTPGNSTDTDRGSSGEGGVTLQPGAAGRFILI